MEQDIILKNLEYLGQKYCQRYLSEWDPEILEKNWWEGLKFFLIHSFMRGRKDELSNAYYYFTIEVLAEIYINKSRSIEEAYGRLFSDKIYFNKNIILELKKQNKIGKNSFQQNPRVRALVLMKNPLVEQMISPRKIKFEWNKRIFERQVHLGNDTDIFMVLDVLRFITSEPKQKSIYKFIKDMIKDHKVSDAYNLLKGSHLYGISDKIASFIIRDILLLNPMIDIKGDDLKMAFPVDTWVRKLSHRLGFPGDNTDEIRNYFINLCCKEGINAPKMAAGMWYLGFHSLDVLIDNCLDNFEFQSRCKKQLSGD